MDMLLAAAADAQAHHAKAADRHPMTLAEEDTYYVRHTLNVTVPAWMVGLFALLRHRSAPGRIRAARHA